MFGFIDRQAQSVGAQRLRDVAAETSLDARLTRHEASLWTGGARQALGVALVAIGQRVAGEMPAGQAAPADGDCA